MEDGAASAAERCAVDEFREDSVADSERRRWDQFPPALRPSQHTGRRGGKGTATNGPAFMWCKRKENASAPLSTQGKAERANPQMPEEQRPDPLNLLIFIPCLFYPSTLTLAAVEVSVVGLPLSCNHFKRKGNQLEKNRGVFLWKPRQGRGRFRSTAPLRAARPRLHVYWFCRSHCGGDATRREETAHKHTWTTQR